MIAQVGYVAPEILGMSLHEGQVLPHAGNPNANLNPNRRGNKKLSGCVSSSLGRGKGGRKVFAVRPKKKKTRVMVPDERKGIRGTLHIRGSSPSRELEV
jgi:hypothetical protein